MSSQDFYPRSPCGERLKISLLLRPLKKFLSTLSLRRATRYFTYYIGRFLNFYPRSPCGERRVEGDNFFYYADISIHALLAESDADCPSITVLHCNFYPRSPCGERHFAKTMSVSNGLFLSTLSLRRATRERLE